MQSTPSLDDLSAAQGQPVYSADGEKIGKVEDIYLDDATGRPEWIGIGTGFLGGKRLLVPTAAARLDKDGFYVGYDKKTVKETPGIASDHIDQETEAALYAHYGLDYSESRSESGLPEGAAPGAPAAATDSVTLAEEELQVEKQSVEAGRVRLRKWVETEPVTADVEVRQEVARIEREPINEPVSGADLGEAEVEVPLHAEQPVVSKKTVAKERVSVAKDAETKTQKVEDTVRKEHLEVDGDNVTNA